MAEIIERLTAVEVKCLDLESKNIGMATDIKEIKERLLGRPTWSVTIVITVLTTICTGLSMFVITGR